MPHQTKRNFSSSPVKIFASYYRPHWKLFAADMFCALLISAVDLLFPMLTRYTLEKLLGQNLLRLFAAMIALMVFIYILRLCFSFFVTYWGHTVGTYIEADMRRDLFNHLQELPFSFYDNHRTGHIMSRVTTDLFEITELAHHGPEDLFISVLTLSGSFILIVTIRWELALVLAVMIPLFVIHIAFSRRRLMAVSRKVKERTAEINASLESSISGVRVAKAFTNEDYEAEKFSAGNESFKLARKGYYRAMAFFHSKIEFMNSILMVTVIAAGGFLITRGRMNLADLVACNLFIAAFLQPIRRLQNFVEQFTTGMAGFVRFLEIMRMESDITDREGAVSLENVRGDISYNDVTFSYLKKTREADAAPDYQKKKHYVLDHISMAVPAGSTTALVGPSGGGKTTLCHLLPRFYETSGGSITIDGVDIRDFTLLSLRGNIGIVQQDVFLFAGTIRENIGYGKIDAADSEIIEAAKQADIHEDILRMPAGYDTPVGERGIKLSGGQKQRVSIARIFLKNPPILILDEATSALDTATEQKIQRALEKLSQGRTTLIIAHRLSTVRNAGNIIVLGDKGILQRGRHEELLAEGGLYADLYKAQFKPYKE
ncbi:MAG: ABC transporter ATP-binding protein/permease [Spirochaetaceae bacterium]|jgi:ATP-binding cassette subfamily B protein|nr:ABC transporter ATP-binding protein/permease [Spirochaetaceae bacterium]